MCRMVYDDPEQCTAGCATWYFSFTAAAAE
jgi:hypothetical protein